MRRWLAMGAVVGFALAVLAISVLGGPGDQPAPAPAAPVDAGAAPPAPLNALPLETDRPQGAIGRPLVVEQPLGLEARRPMLTLDAGAP